MKKKLARHRLYMYIYILRFNRVIYLKHAKYLRYTYESVFHLLSTSLVLIGE